MKNGKKRILATALALLIIASQMSGLGVLAEEVIAAGSNESEVPAHIAAVPTLLTEKGGSFYVRSVADLKDLAARCAIDSFSEGVNVILTADLDLSNEPGLVIPVFGGTFDGGGHKITGLAISGNASHTGLFRYVSEKGRIRNLTVEGTVTPGGTGEHIGGIVGNNFGTISGCTFSGNVEGIASIGAIAGTNEKTGTIESCRIFGYVGGDRFVGGIVGQNLGTVRQCTNSGDVNTIYRNSENTPKLEINVQQLDLNQLTEPARLNAIGGIVGFNTGVLRSCTNVGGVGYDRLGVNIGGIAGRQSGYMQGCNNTGTVKGRMDVGGIVGQMEPYLEIDLTAGSAENLVKQLNILHDLMNKALGTAEASSASFAARLTGISSYMGAAFDDMDYLSKKTIETIDKTYEAINEISGRIDYAMDNLPEVLEYIESATKSLESGFEYLKIVNEDLAIISKMENSYYDETDYMLLTITDGTGGVVTTANLNPAAGQEVGFTVTPEPGYKLNSIVALDEDGNDVVLKTTDGTVYTMIMPIKSGDPVNDPVNAIAKNTVIRASFVPTDDWQAQNPEANVCVVSNEGGRLTATPAKAVKDEKVVIGVRMNEGYAMSVLKVTDKDGNAVSYLKENNSGTAYSFKMPDGGYAKVEATFVRKSNWEVVKEAQYDMKLRSQRLTVNVAKVKQEINDILVLLKFTYDPATDTWIPPKKIKLSKEEERQLLALLAALANDSAKVLEDIAGIVSDLNTILKVTGPFVSEAAQAANEHLAIALQHFQDASNSMTKATSAMKAIFQHLNGLPDVKFPTLGSEYSQRMDSLLKNLRGASNSLGGFGEDIDRSSKQLIAELRAVNDQLNLVLLMFVDAMNNIMNKSLASRCTDVPEEDINSTEGKVRSCSNTGAVQGETNVGGITGSMDLENKVEPTNALTGMAMGALAPHYFTKCYMRDCESTGVITAKKDHVGALVGMQSIGSVADSRGFGAVSSEGGNYVGGVAGRSMSVIADSWAMCSLSGGSRIGGIAGYGTNVANSHSLINVDSGKEYIGAIVGEKNEDKGEVAGNTFVSKTLGGIDGISFAGKAEPIPYEQLRKIENIPSEFSNLKLTFMADGQKVATMPFEYGGSIDKNTMPAVPEKKGYTGVWPTFPTEDLRFSRTIVAEYIGLNTTIASGVQRGGTDLPAVLAEGDFRPTANIDVKLLDIRAVQEKLDLEVPAIIGITPLEAIVVKIDGGIEGSDGRKLRYLPPEFKNRMNELVLYKRTEDGWKEVPYSSSGKYSVVDVTGDEHIFIAAERTRKVDRYLFLAGGAVGVLALAGITIALIKGKKKKRKGGHLKNSD